MATSYEEIYCLNKAIMENTKINSAPLDVRYFVLYKYLEFGIALFRNKCFKDLDDRTEFEQEVYEFTGDGINDTFPLTPAPPTGSSFYVTIDMVEVPDTEYTITTSPDEIKFNTIPADGAVGRIGAYVIGEFNQTLNVSEKTILAEAMTPAYTESKINLDKALNQLLYGKGVNFHSQANHNKVNLDIKNSNYAQVKGLINKYTYTEQDSLSGLAGVRT